MRCVTPLVLYTKVDARYDKLATVIGRTIDNTRDVFSFSFFVVMDRILINRCLSINLSIYSTSESRHRYRVTVT